MVAVDETKPWREGKMSDAEAKAAKIAARMAETQRKAAVAVATSTIGEAVCRLLRVGKPVSLETLMALLEEDVATSPSAAGNGNPLLDSTRLTAEAAITRLRQETES
jgi:hypothetical protein